MRFSNLLFQLVVESLDNFHSSPTLPVLQKKKGVLNEVLLLYEFLLQLLYYHDFYSFYLLIS